MNILILNGSPSGPDSITLYTMHYIRTFFPEHTYEILDVGRQIKALEKDPARWVPQLEQADLIVFCYPVYTFLVPSQLHRFIELIKEQGISVSGKYATQVTTSKHFYDVTAHVFIRDCCDDLGLHYIRGLSADMDDLTRKKGQKEAVEFFRHTLWAAEQGWYEPPQYPQGYASARGLSASENRDAIVQAKDGNVVVVTDYDPQDPDSERLQSMIRRFVQVMPRETSVVNLREFPFAGGCLGCFRCAADGTCIYRDGFDRYLRENIQKGSAIVYAYTIRDHSMGSRFKMYDDRQFCNGHRTVTMGMPHGYLVDGDLAREDNLKVLMEARAQVGGNYLCGIASNMQDPDREIDRLAAELDYAIGHQYTQPANFYGVGGLKIFRDLIYTMRGMMKEDHRFYKEHGFYDFPQKKVGTIVGMYAVGAMMNSEKLRKKIGGKMTEGMIMPYKAVVEKAAKKQRKRSR